MLAKTYDNLRVGIADTGPELGEAAAALFAERAARALQTKDSIGAIIALGAAQDDFFAALKARDDIEWNRISILIVDVYMGISNDDPRSAGARMQRHLVDDVKPKGYFPMFGDTVPVEAELKRYTDIYHELEPSICVVGVGDTGHLAFIDPPADFETTSVMVAVRLAPETRSQIIAAGLFDSPADAPEYGISLTIPALLKPETVIGLVHEKSKATAIRKMLEEPVSIMLPASKMRDHPDAHLFLSHDASSELSL